jgi:hypothetical protein
MRSARYPKISKNGGHNMEFINKPAKSITLGRL